MKLKIIITTMALTAVCLGVHAQEKKRKQIRIRGSYKGKWEPPTLPETPILEN